MIAKICSKSSQIHLLHELIVRFLHISINYYGILFKYFCRGQGYGFGDDKSGIGGDRRSSDPHDSDSDSELDIEGPGSPSDLRDEDLNTSGDRDRSRDESGSEEDPLTKTSPVSSGLHYPGWPAHPAFSSLTGSGPPTTPHQPGHLALNKITSQFWGFDPRPPLATPPAPAPHPLDSLSLSFPLSFPGLQSHFFKLPQHQQAAESEARSQMFRFRSST